MVAEASFIFEAIVGAERALAQPGFIFGEQKGGGVYPDAFREQTHR